MIYTGPKFLSALMTVTLSHRLRILKMLNFSFKFLRPHYFITLPLIFFIFGLMKILHSANPPPPPPPAPPPPPHTHTHTHAHRGHIKIKVTDLEFSRNNMCNIRQASLSSDRSCFMVQVVFALYLEESCSGDFALYFEEYFMNKINLGKAAFRKKEHSMD